MVSASVIVAVGRSHYHCLPGQLRQLEAQKSACSFEVLVADNSGVLELDPADFAINLKVVLADEVAGPAWARNRAAEEARSSVLLFCDADDFVGPGWLDSHLRALQTSRFTCGSFLHVYDEPAVAKTVESHDSWTSDLFSTHPVRHEGTDTATSANMGIDRNLFRQLGGFPVQYRRSEDVAFSLAAMRSDEDLDFVPGARVLKVNRRLSAKERLMREIQAGEARVRIWRDYRVGPSPLVLVSRAIIRLFRSLISTNGSTSTEAGQLVGISLETARSLTVLRKLLPT